MEEPKTFKAERWLIASFCAFAALRVFLFAAAFPFFSNIDESAQLDVVLKYSNREWPRSLSAISPESARYLSVFGSPEFSSGKEPGTPVWKRPLATVASVVASRENWWRQHLNYEALEPPLYYLLAGWWHNAGQAVGLEGGAPLYWIRFLNVGLAAALVWLAYAAARIVFPDRLFLRLGVSFLVAVWPQDIFYSIQSDVLSPVCFGLAFLGLLRMFSNEEPRPWTAAFAGLAMAATVLVKVSNFSFVAVALAAVALRAWIRWREGKLRAHFPAIALFFLAAGMPIAIWCLRNYYVVGDLTASSAKIRFLGWSVLPFAAWWQHPIFTIAGLWTFYSDLLATFWRGEFIWHGARFSFRAVDLFYAVSSALFLGAAAVSLLRGSPEAAGFQRRSLGLSVSIFLASLLALALLSIIFDFGNCLYPSREYPFFASGRLFSGAVIPIMLLYVFGLDTVLRSLRLSRFRYLVLGVIGLSVTGSEVALSLGVFASRYNFFHM